MKRTFYCTLTRFSLPAAFLSRSWMRGKQGGRVYTTAQVCPPAELRSACSGRSKSLELALLRGTAFPQRRAVQDHRNYTFSAIRSIAVSHGPSSSQALYFAATTTYTTAALSFVTATVLLCLCEQSSPEDAIATRFSRPISQSTSHRRTHLITYK